MINLSNYREETRMVSGMQPKNELLFNKQALDRFATALHRLTGLHNRDYSL